MSPPGSAPAATELIETIISDAMFMASLTAQYLEQLDILPSRKQLQNNPVAFPPEFLLELAAVLRLALWERAGLRDHLDSGLPPAEQAWAALFARFGLLPQEVCATESESGLKMRVFETTFRQLAHAGRGELNADIVLREPEETILLEALADYLWTHRHAGTPD